jgi:hypothetical protein
MGSMSADGCALLGAAVRAAILAGAPRRTVQAVAVGVTGALLGTPAAAPALASDGRAGMLRAAAAGPTDASAETLLEALRASRSEGRKKKRQRRKAREVARRGVASEMCADALLDGVAALERAVATPVGDDARDTDMPPPPAPRPGSAAPEHAGSDSDKGLSHSSVPLRTSSVSSASGALGGAGELNLEVIARMCQQFEDNLDRKFSVSGQSGQSRPL